jgi:hypothetical protein
MELDLIAHPRPLRVVDVLLARFFVAPDRLDVRVLDRADPYLRPGRRNDQRLDP